MLKNTLVQVVTDGPRAAKQSAMSKSATKITEPTVKKAKGEATRALILRTAGRLFNEENASDVTTNQIAAAAGISPGNLYYYFRNKEEIIRGLFPEIRQAIAEPLVYPTGEPISAERMAHDYVKAIEVLWQHRFFFADMIGLGRRDPELGQMIQAMQDEIISTLGILYTDLIAQGDMKPVEKKTLEFLSLNSFLIWFSWVSFMDRAAEPWAEREERLADGALACLAVVDPYLKPGYRTAVHEAMDALMHQRRKST